MLNQPIQTGRTGQGRVPMLNPPTALRLLIAREPRVTVDVREEEEKKEGGGNEQAFHFQWTRRGHLTVAMTRDMYEHQGQE